LIPLLRWLEGTWVADEPRIADEIGGAEPAEPPRRADRPAETKPKFTDWLLALVQAWCDADKLGARTPEQARDRTGLRSLGELLSVVDRKDHKLLQAQLLVAWLWALGRDEDLGDGALTN